ncbi:hypothetical protein, partial [Rhodococcus qingshengii]|uniref:hypothetical protein n=1 Tax=Rhodococcus qingshengii TaxID=334542 RepID=UPI001BAED8B0
AASSDPVTVGVPITSGGPCRGVREMILDARLQAVPVGAPGELYTAGIGLPRGSPPRPGLASVRLRDDPFRIPVVALFRT